jgi:outer membrane protein assembly factor BamB
VTPLVVGDLVFFWSDQGIVTCVDAASGDVHWQQRVGGSFYSSPVCAAGAVYNISTSGEVVVLAAAARSEELARNQLDEASHATPAIADGSMYVRTFTQLLSIRGGR